MFKLLRTKHEQPRITKYLFSYFCRHSWDLMLLLAISYSLQKLENPDFENQFAG
jgi:hypothetical protein